MKTIIQLKAALGALALAVLVPVSLEAQSRPTFIGSPNLVRDAEPEMIRGTDAALLRLADKALAGEEWREGARASGLSMQEGRVLVEFSTSPYHADGSELDSALVEFAKEFSGDHGVIAGANPLMCRVWIRAEDIRAFAAKAGENFHDARVVAYRAPQSNSYGLVSSEGEYAIKSNLYGLHGKGVTIAVMDLGFEGVHSTESGSVEFPLSMDDTDLGPSPHGAAMIEVLRDMAPEANILAYRIDENVDIYTAALNAVSTGANIIVSSLTWFDLPGRSLADEAVNIAATNGALWVNAAGNFADGRYFETESMHMHDLGGEAYLAFADEDPYQFIDGLAAGDAIRVHLAQESLSDAGAQLALELYSWNGMSADLVLEDSGNPDLRVQTIAHTAEDGMYYFPMLRVVREGELRMRMFIENGQLHFNGQEGSIAAPGGNRRAITVGAVNVDDYGIGASVETYSGRGGGIFDLTLDLCGPTNCTTGIYGSQGFSGTSAAAAHIAGLLALHLTDKALRIDPVAMILKLDIMDDGNDIHSGAGLAMAQVDDAEPDNSIDSATDLISVGQRVEGRSLSPSHDRDWYSFELTEAMSAVITVTGKVERVRLFQRLDDDGTESMLELDSLIQPVLNPGTYLVNASGGFVADYSISLDLYQDAPSEVTGLTPGNEGYAVGTKQEPDGLAAVSLSWDAAVGIGPITYHVEVVDASNPRTILADLTVDGTSVTVAGLEFGQKCIWRVRSMNEHGESDFTKDHSFKVVELSVVDDSDRDSVASDTDATPRTVTMNAVLGVSEINEESSNDAAGCAGNTGSNGMIALLIAMVAVAGGVRTMRKREKAKA